ncbi:uncharacterized protein LOC134273532, partial [Saccostrea cucullata]|uniref:uncharacterized protein LOC134273532 n=1 Tax=Saccostrea cuccullata TaxID=36930 RepID=UPI002ED315AE
VINTEDKVTETLEIERKDKATETDVVGQTKNKKTNTNWKVNLKDKSTSCQSLEKVDQSTQYDDTHVNRLLPSPPVDPARSDERPRKSGDQTSGTESEHSEEEDDAKEDGDNRESLTGERLPKPFHRINIFGKTLKENVEKVPELLKRGLRVIKGPNYDHEKLTAVPGDYIGTVICVDFEEDLPEVWEYTKEQITKIAVFRRGKSGNAFGKEYVDRFNKPHLVTNQLNTYVEVQWDNGQRELCAIGPLKFELLVYNTNEIHDNFMCNGCNEEPIIGTRWTCVTCKFRNLCTSCYMANKYNRNHVFQRIMMKGGKGKGFGAIERGCPQIYNKRSDLSIAKLGSKYKSISNTRNQSEGALSSPS